MSDIRIKATDGTGEFAAHVAQPKKSGAAPGVIVVIQEIFGVNQSLRETCAQLAEMGFIAIAPDLFWRQEPGVDISDKTDAEWQKAFALMNGFDQKKGIEDLKATLAVARAYPGANGKAGTIGYCLGGRLAVMMATGSDADVNISYYGVGLDDLVPEFWHIDSPLLIHIAEEDEFSSPEIARKVMLGLAGLDEVEAVIYPGVQHAFARVGGVHYDARAATIANGRSVALLADILG